MKVSEKSLELNVGAELLGLLRGGWGMPKAYLRGLTQREEKQEGVDFFAQLDSATRLFAFQFKAPKGTVDTDPYRYRLVRAQHEMLFSLAEQAPYGVFYVFPFYVTPRKLQQDVPRLINDTWSLRVGQMPTDEVFGISQTRTIRCVAGRAVVNPEYAMKRLADLLHRGSDGISVNSFALWYKQQHNMSEGFLKKRRNPWLVRGLRLAIVAPEDRPGLTPQVVG